MMIEQNANKYYLVQYISKYDTVSYICAIITTHMVHLHLGERRWYKCLYHGTNIYTIGTNKCTTKAWYKYLYQFRTSSLFSDNPVLKSSKGILNCAHLGGRLR